MIVEATELGGGVQETGPGEGLLSFQQHVREGVAGKETEGGEETSQENSWRKSTPGRGNSQCKGPEVGVCLVCFRKDEEVNGAEVGGEGGVR